MYLVWDRWETSLQKQGFALGLASKGKCAVVLHTNMSFQGRYMYFVQLSVDGMWCFSGLFLSFGCNRHHGAEEFAKKLSHLSRKVQTCAAVF